MVQYCYVHKTISLIFGLTCVLQCNCASVTAYIGHIIVLEPQGLDLSIITMVRWRGNGIWITEDGVKYTGGTAAVPGLTIHNVTSADEGSYYMWYSDSIPPNVNKFVSIRLEIEEFISSTLTTVLENSTNLMTMSETTKLHVSTAYITSSQVSLATVSTETPALQDVSFTWKSTVPHYVMQTHSITSTFVERHTTESLAFTNQENTSTYIPTSCNCVCRNETKLSSKELYDWIVNVQQELRVNISNLSSAMRRKVSVYDGRMSAVTIGSVGVGFLIIVPTIIILLDCSKVIHLLMLRLKSRR